MGLRRAQNNCIISILYGLSLARISKCTIRTPSNGQSHLLLRLLKSIARSATYSSVIIFLGQYHRTSSQPRLSEGRGSLVLHGGIFHIISLYIYQCPSRQSDKRLEPNPAGLLKQRITRTSAADGTITSPQASRSRLKPLQSPRTVPLR